MRTIFLASETDFSHFWLKNDALCASTDDQTFIQQKSMIFKNQDAISSKCLCRIFQISFPLLRSQILQMRNYDGFDSNL